ncbi:MAG: ISAzo13 family transposase [Actinobacteria bacterium]|nr:ISAzo13 family transposase [Actinomycetota bacterium]
MASSSPIASVRQKYKSLAPLLHEKARRRWAACEAVALGRGGISLVATATGLSRPVIRRGIVELNSTTDQQDAAGSAPRIRRPGGGRPCLTTTDPALLQELQRLVDPTTRGDPMSPLLWTCKSTRHLAETLGRLGHAVSHQTVARLLGELGYSLQANRKTEEGKDHPERNAQFEHINRKVGSFQRRGQPVVSVDTKKKELVGNYKNPGQEWQPKGQPEAVKSKDFPDKELGKVSPYGVYDMTANEGWVNVGITHDTAEFAVESVRRWWHRMGQHVYPEATALLITADGGGSNGSRSRLWKVCLQRLADELGLKISVCHFPPGTSKWNKIEHRMFCHITENWRGRPLVSHGVVVNLIGSTKTRTGLRVKADLDTNDYATGIKVTDAELRAVRLKREKFHGNWNYQIIPQQD